MFIALVLLLQLPAPMPAAEELPTSADEWAEYLGAPALWERERFGSRWNVTDARRFNRAHQEWIESQLEIETRPACRAELEVWLAETRELYRIWDALDDAWCGYPEWRQRVGLARVREAIGDAAFERGEMPPCVPTWRFRDLRP